MTGFEPLVTAAAAGLTGLITEIVKEKAGKVLGQADIDLPNPSLNKASQQYLQNYKERHGILKVVCARMDAPVKLDSIYTPAQLLNRSETRYFESAETLQRLFRKIGKRRFDFGNSPKQEGILLANKHQYLMVLGAPGVGKSSFLKKIGLEALKLKDGAFNHNSIPVFLELKQFNSNEVEIKKVIAQEFETCGLPDSENFTEAALEKGKLLILLDGLDEIPNEYLSRTITQIRNLVDRYSKNRFIASCRTAAYKGGFDRFKDVVMASFDDSQIEHFIHYWFQTDDDRKVKTAEKCWELLRQPEYSAAKELARTPLLLTLLVSVYDQSLDFPRKRASLYGEALDVLLKKWAAERRLQHNFIYQDLSSELELMLLAELAYENFVENRLFFPKQEVVEQIKNFLFNILNAPEHLDGESVLSAIEVQQGILVEQTRNTYSFSHLTLQEYLTAKYIVANNQIENLVAEHLTDNRWNEVFLLVAGLMLGRDGASELLLKIEKQAYTYIESPKLRALLAWSEYMTSGSAGNHKPAVKRAVAIFLALALALAYTRHSDHAHNLAAARNLALARNIAVGLARVLTQDHDIDRDIDPVVTHDLTLDLTRTLSHARDLARDLDLDRARARDLAFARTFAHEKVRIFKDVNFAELISKLELLEVESLNKSQSSEDEELRNLTSKIQEVWLNTFKLNSEMLSFSEEDTQLLQKFLEANFLILACRKAAVSISYKTWNDIENRLLSFSM